MPFIQDIARVCPGRQPHRLQMCDTGAVTHGHVLCDVTCVWCVTSHVLRVLCHVSEASETSVCHVWCQWARAPCVV